MEAAYHGYESVQKLAHAFLFPFPSLSRLRSNRQMIGSVVQKPLIDFAKKPMGAGRREKSHGAR